MKGFRSHHHPPSLDFSWRNVRNPAQLRTHALQQIALYLIISSASSKNDSEMLGPSA